MHILLTIWCIAFVLFAPAQGLAQPQCYVAEVQEITMRTGPSLENKVVQILKSGSPLDKVREEGDWVQVRTETGREGWVLKRYITREVPARIQFENFKAKNAELIDKADRVESIVGKYERENKALQESLANLQTQLTAVKNDYDALARANSDVTDMTRKFQEMKAALETARQDMEKIKRENETLRDLSDVKWFLAGAGVFFGGWLFGYFIGRSARKKSNRMYL